ncbi:MAG: site-specific DNA-methyltransferase [Lentisphaeria bacterium]
MCGDCLEVMREMPDGCVDAVVTDPPWMDYETGRYDASEWHAPIAKVPPSQYMGLLFRVLRAPSAMVLWCRWDCFDEHAAAARSVGFDVRNQIVWGKPNHTAGDLDGNLGNRHECAVFAVKGRWKRDSGREVNLWIEPHLFSRDRRYHPTQKPVGLMKRSVSLVCVPGAVVLDPFAGSGTTGVACKYPERCFIGIERDPDYCAIARARIEPRGELL